jgi:hypothetical protein
VLSHCINQLNNLPDTPDTAVLDAEHSKSGPGDFSIPETMQEIFDISNRNRKKNKERKKNKDDGAKDGS